MEDDTWARRSAREVIAEKTFPERPYLGHGGGTTQQENNLSHVGKTPTPLSSRIVHSLLVIKLENFNHQREEEIGPQVSLPPNQFVHVCHMLLPTFWIESILSKCRITPAKLGLLVEQLSLCLPLYVGTIPHVLMENRQVFGV